MPNKETIIETADLLKAVAHPIRLCLVTKLMQTEKLNVTHFTGCMEASQSNISQHLRKLKDANILGSEKKEQMVYYFIINDKVREIINILFTEDIYG